jgi:hypothetical protein
VRILKAGIAVTLLADLAAVEPDPPTGRVAVIDWLSEPRLQGGFV